MKRSELNSSVLSSPRTRGPSDVAIAALGRGLPLAILALLVAVPASAQSDTVRVRTVSTWQKDVDQMRKELIEKQRVELELVRMYNMLERQRQVASDSQLSTIRAQSQFVITQLRSAVDDQLRLKKQLETMCAAVQKPEGWLGVTTTGMQLLDRQVGGPQIIRFLETPVVASVDPGSPAERVGLRAGDELVEIAGKRLLQSNIVFADLLKPGNTVLVKFRRGNDVIIVEPKVVPAPNFNAPCMLVDATTAFTMVPAQAQVRGEVVSTPAGYVYTTTTSPDSNRVATVGAGGVRRAQGGQAVATGATGTVVPMARMFGNGNSLAGLELMALNPESGSAFGVSYGLFVNQVLPGTPGREAGLQGGDVLVTADSMPLRSLMALRQAINRSRDRAVTITIMRRGKQESVQLKW